MLEKYKYFDDEKVCPICSRKLSKYGHEHYWEAQCGNDCFRIEHFCELGKFRITFPNLQYYGTEEEIISHFNRNVKYWKENDRYLAEILARS